jgi:hypothetical protein
MAVLQQSLNAGNQSLLALTAARAEDNKKWEQRLAAAKEELRRVSETARQREDHYEELLRAQGRETQDARKSSEVPCVACGPPFCHCVVGGWHVIPTPVVTPLCTSVGSPSPCDWFHCDHRRVCVCVCSSSCVRRRKLRRAFTRRPRS